MHFNKVEYFSPISSATEPRLQSGLPRSSRQTLYALALIFSSHAPSRFPIFLFSSFLSLSSFQAVIMSRILTSGALAALCALGYYGVFGPAIYNGLFPAILKTSVPPKYCPGGPAPFQTRYTGIAVVDDQFGLLICFLTIVLQGPRTLDITLVSAYLGLQFFAGWVLVCLEGLRHGNRGRIVSW